MTLTFEEVKSITLGAVSVTEQDDCIKFHRMTDTQAQAFIREDGGFADKTEATAGVRFDFYTDSPFVDIKLTNLKSGSSRKFFGVDVTLDGNLYMHYYSDDLNVEQPDDIFIPLKGKESRVQVFFPNLASTDVEYVEISDDSFVRPFTPKLNLLCYGDSITQGYDAKFSSGSYVNIIATTLDAQVFDQAIGGAKFNSEIIEPLPVTPDVITVAYGTNDWNGRDADTFTGEAAGFFDKLASVHAGVKTFVILPIWRADWANDKPAGGFYECRKIIADLALSHGFNVIDDIDLVPNDTRMFSDLYLHPNDLGFEPYGKGVAEHILKNI